MRVAQPSILARDDTFFGICEGIGQDLRIPPNLIRLGLAVGVFFNPAVVVVSYAGMGVIVAVSRWIAPDPVRMIEVDEAFHEDFDLPAVATLPRPPEEERVPLAA